MALTATQKLASLAQQGPSRIAERLAEQVGGSAGEGSVFGAAVERNGVTVIPVARSRWAFGGGFGQEDGSTERVGSGGGGAANVRPVGFIEISGGRARFRRIVDPATVAGVLLAVAFLGFRGLRRRRPTRRTLGGCRRGASRTEEPMSASEHHGGDVDHPRAAGSASGSTMATS